MSDDLEALERKIEKLRGDDAEAMAETRAMGMSRSERLVRLYLAREKAQEAQFKAAFSKKRRARK